MYLKDTAAALAANFADSFTEIINCLLSDAHTSRSMAITTHIRSIAQTLLNTSDQTHTFAHCNGAKC